ncbi:redoxin domain-containing protein [Alkalimonas amylolytica]|uniref:Peroxiredoxin n=1 Tax=Alkalimonas amylolytica TaxID=152573 RepID=A0A1H4EJH2_ALKAM|nr:redoxin domain-containing protein [Alkalimonas amylolytica]SEA85214.1 Peroxiredoxin [Alkalimonas amylolytica]
MKLKQLFSALALAGTVTAVAAAPQIGAPAPDFTVVDSHGQTHSLADFAGKNVILEWTNHECPFVVKHYVSDNMQGLQQHFADADTVWLSVISSKPGSQGHVSPAKANELTASRGAQPAAVLLDESGDMGRAFDARVTPHMYVIGADGNLLYMGGIDSIPTANPADIPKAEPYLANAGNQVIAGQPVGKPVTRPYGCSIKY